VASKFTRPLNSHHSRSNSGISSYLQAGILLNWPVFEVLDPCGEGSSGFLFTEHLVLRCEEISSIEKPETPIYRGKNLIGKIFLLRVTENSSNGRNITWKRHEFSPVT
jgi:hypothetical protein